MTCLQSTKTADESFFYNVSIIKLLPIMKSAYHVFLTDNKLLITTNPSKIHNILSRLPFILH